jgi:hypothetical protein
VVRKVLQPLVNVAHLLSQADNAPTLKRFAKKLLQARRAAGQAQQKLAKVRVKLSSSCVMGLDLVTADTRTALSCLP